jgi:hypothetical protein
MVQPNASCLTMTRTPLGRSHEPATFRDEDVAAGQHLRALQSPKGSGSRCPTIGVRSIRHSCAGLGGPGSAQRCCSGARWPRAAPSSPTRRSSAGALSISPMACAEGGAGPAIRPRAGTRVTWRTRSAACASGSSCPALELGHRLATRVAALSHAGFAPIDRRFRRDDNVNRAWFAPLICGKYRCDCALQIGDRTA